METGIRDAMACLGGQVLGGLLAAERGHQGQRVGCGSGHQAVFVAYRGKTLHTVLGPVTISRAWYHCRVCERGHAPRDKQLGVTRTGQSPGLAAMIDVAAATVPFAQASKLLSDLAGVTVATKTVERVAEADGRAAEADQVEQTKAILANRLVPLPPPGPLPDMLYLAIDGTGLPMRASETLGRAGKGPDGRARTREAKVAALFTQTCTTTDGHPVRDPNSTNYLATLQPVDHFADLLTAEARRRGSEHIRQLVVLGDGARWIWKLADQRLPAATQIVDLFHAREHLHALADQLAFIATDPSQWLTDRLAELDNGDIEALCAAARTYHNDLVGPKATEVDKAITYFETNAHRMRYAHYRSMGMFVGSGVVEAACKNVLGARLKRSGMHWTTRGATAISILRCQQASAA